MNPTSPQAACESIQEALAEALDLGREPAAGLQAHLHGCADCRQFLAFWQEGPGLDLAKPLPGAGIQLRHAILNFPQQLNAAPAPLTAVPPPPARTATATPWLRVAALVALGAVAGVMLNPRRADPGRTLAEHRSGGPSLTQPMDHELVALRDDLQDGVRAVSGPLTAFLSPLQP